MKSEAMRSSRFTVNQARKKKSSSNKLSQSPTLASSYSQKSLWPHSYKNQPFPKQFRRKLWGKKFQFDLYSDDEQQIAAVMEQEEEGNQKKIKRLPHFKLISDQGQFISKRCRIKSEVQFRCRQKVKSVQSLKCLPQVLQQKRQEDDLKRLSRSKLSYFKDKNQFNQRKRKSSDSHTQIASKVQSLQNVFFSNTANGQLPQQIEQNEAEQTKSVKLPGERSIITAEIQKIIVDELDSRRRKEQMKPKDIQQIIEQQKLQQDDQNAKVSRLRQSLSKFETESEYLKLLRDEQVVTKSGKDIDISSENVRRLYEKENQQNAQGELLQASLQREKLQYEEIMECSSSGKQEDYQDLNQLAVIKQQPKEQKNLKYKDKKEGKQTD